MTADQPLTRRAARRRSTLVAACARLARTLDAGRGTAVTGLALPGVAGPDDDGAPAGDSLITACRLVGAESGIEIVTPPATHGEEGDRIEAIVRASRIRSRRVMLRGTWWRQDNGPLLAIRTEGRSPVALRYHHSRGYTCLDPVSGAETKVDAALADTLSPFAITFYRSFPEVALSIRHVLRFGVHGCGGELGTVVVMTVLAALLGMIPPIATGLVFDTLIPGAQRSQLLQLTLILLACALAVAMFQAVRGVALLRIEGKMGNAVQCAVWDRLLALPMSFFRPYTAGELAVRAMGIDGIRQIVSGATVTGVVAGLTSLGNYALLFRYDVRLALWATLLLVVALAVTLLGASLQLRHQRKVAALQSKTSGVVLQLLTSIAKLRVAGVEAHAFAKWAAKFAEQRGLQFRVRSIGNGVAAFNAGFPIASCMLVYWAALASLSMPHGMRAGDFLAFMAAFGICLASLVTSSNALLTMLLAVPLYEQARSILVTPPEVDGSREDPGRLTGAIEIEHVSFRYEPDGPLALRDVTVRVRAGEFIAFVGPSGSGKSTLLRLLLGFESPEGGSIYYDGHELGALDLRTLRRQLGVVLQSGRLMTGDIYTNIVGAVPMPMDAAWEAARMAGFADDIRQMPMGMNTVISEGGGTLSGGQRQRLMIARAVAHRPRILLFDEATSALDNRTQAIVSASLERLSATRIVIAHRLSTIMRADRIYVLRAGEVVQCGSYDELMREEGLFAELAARQLA